jgi:lipoprotein NlpD
MVDRTCRSYRLFFVKAVMMNWQLLRIAIWLCIAGLVYGCAGSWAPVRERNRETPDRYLVVRGDTLIAIAWRYGLDYREVAEWNRLKSPNLIYAGQYLWLRSPPRQPDQLIARNVQTAKSKTNAQSIAKPSHKSKPPLTSPQPNESAVNKVSHSIDRTISTPAADETTWRWPTEGTVVQGYDPEVPGGKGIQIGGALGQPVWAALPGQVVYSGSGLPGYGRLIIVKHSNNLLSAYGYLGRIFVKEGDNVSLGQSIAELGASNENRPVLHFEIRRNGKPVNPLDFLPS